MREKISVTGTTILQNLKIHTMFRILVWGRVVSMIGWPNNVFQKGRIKTTFRKWKPTFPTGNLTTQGKTFALLGELNHGDVQAFKECLGDECVVSRFRLPSPLFGRLNIQLLIWVFAPSEKEPGFFCWNEPPRGKKVIRTRHDVNFPFEIGLAR